MAAPVFAAATLLTEGTAANAVVAVPAGVAVDTVIIVHIFKENTAAVTPPAGFTEITPPAQTSPTIIDHRTFWKRATGADSTAYTFSWTGSIWRQAAATSYTGCVLTGSPVDVSTTAARNSAGTVTPSVSLTTTGADRMLVWSGTNDSGGTWTPPTGFTSRATGSPSWLTVASKAQATAGSTGSLTGTAASAADYETATLLALLPLSSTQTLTATAIVSGETFGAAAVVQNIGPATGIVPGEVFGVSGVAPVLVATGIISGETFGAAVIDSGLHTFGVASAEAFGPAVVQPGPVTLTGVGVASAGTFGASVVLPSVLNPVGIGSGEAFGAAALIPGPVTVTATGIASGEAPGNTAVVQVITSISSQILIRPKPTTTYELVCVAKIAQPAGPPVFIELDPIDWTGLSFTEELSKPAQMQAGCKVNQLSDAILQRFRPPAKQSTELWLYRNGRLVFTGPLRTAQVQGESLSMTAVGALGYLDQMVVGADTVLSGIDQHLIVKALIDQWQALPYGHFGVDTSGVTASGMVRDATYLVKELDVVGPKVYELGARQNGFDITIDPGSRRLLLDFPQRGVDRSTGEDAIIFDERNITSPNVSFSWAPDDLASVVYGIGTGNDTLLSVKVNNDLLAQYGRSATTATFDTVSEQATCDAHTQGVLDARGQALVIPGPDTRVTVDSDISLYDVGDTVTYTPHSLLTTAAAFRIRRRVTTVSDTGQEAVSLEFA